MEEQTTIVKKTVKTGITFGSALAMVISYTTWHSVGWAIFHGLLSWAYVLYFVLTGEQTFPAITFDISRRLSP